MLRYNNYKTAGPSATLYKILWRVLNALKVTIIPDIFNQA